MSERMQKILNLLKKDMNGLTLQQIQKEIADADKYDMTALISAGKVKLGKHDQLYKAIDPDWK